MTIEAQILGLGYHQWLEDTDGIPLATKVLAYDGAHSMQAFSAMLGIAAGAGSSTSSKYLAAAFAEVHGGSSVDETVNLTGTDNIVAGQIAKYSHIGTNASTYPGAALRAEIGDLTTAAYAAVLAVMSGDSGLAQATAAFAVDWNSSFATSRFNHGIDFEGLPTHDGYQIPRYDQAFIRMGGRVVDASGGLVTITGLCIFAGTAAPTDGTSGTGLNFAGPGSVYIRQSGSSSAMYVNANTIGSPTWKLVTQAG